MPLSGAHDRYATCGDLRDFDPWRDASMRATNGSFLQIGNQSGCCRTGSPRFLASGHAHSEPVAISTCAANCSANEHCRFFSVRPDRKSPSTRFRCELCTACTLMRHNQLLRRREIGGSSWAREWTAVSQPYSIGDFVREWLGKYLEGGYSTALYGESAAMHFDKLRVLFLGLLSTKALGILSRIGICQATSAPPLHPFFWHLTPNQGTPLNTVWLHAGHKAQPAPSHSWVEVVHCPSGKPKDTLYRGILYPFWAYAAPGSGLSVNIGRTLVADSFQHAVNLMHQIFGAVDRDGNGTLPSTVSTDYLTSYDSIQILSHHEYFSEELRHEVVLLHRREFESVDGSTKLGIHFMCGRFPSLFTCREQDYKRFATCSEQGGIRTNLTLCATLLLFISC